MSNTKIDKEIEELEYKKTRKLDEINEEILNLKKQHYNHNELYKLIKKFNGFVGKDVVDVKRICSGIKSYNKYKKKDGYNDVTIHKFLYDCKKDITVGKCAYCIKQKFDSKYNNSRYNNSLYNEEPKPELCVKGFHEIVLKQKSYDTWNGDDHYFDNIELDDFKDHNVIQWNIIVHILEYIIFKAEYYLDY